ncbi:hypothetical protein KL941_000831 [Ogataea angusta]|nr:hypothetical protein KL941_000831 [Ogataea angusta]
MKIRAELERQLSMNDERVLKARKIEHRKNLTARLDVSCYLVLIILYLADENLILLLLRGFQQFMLGHPPNSIEASAVLTPAVQRILAQKVLSLGLAFNVLGLVVHIAFSARGGLGQGISYGAYIINIMGENRFEGWFHKLLYLLLWDFVLVALQFSLYSMNFVKQDLDNAEDSDVVASIDVVRIVQYVNLIERAQAPTPSLSEMMPRLGV